MEGDTELVGGGFGGFRAIARGGLATPGPGQAELCGCSAYEGPRVRVRGRRGVAVWGRRCVRSYGRFWFCGRGEMRVRVSVWRRRRVRSYDGLRVRGYGGGRVIAIRVAEPRCGGAGRFPSCTAVHRWTRGTRRRRPLAAALRRFGAVSHRRVRRTGRRWSPSPVSPWLRRARGPARRRTPGFTSPRPRRFALRPRNLPPPFTGDRPRGPPPPRPCHRAPQPSYSRIAFGVPVGVVTRRTGHPGGEATADPRTRPGAVPPVPVPGTARPRGRAPRRRRRTV